MSDANGQRELAVRYMTSREKKNSYTQGAKRIYFFGYPDNVPGNISQKGYSDCSAAVRAAIKAAAGVDIGSNTSAQINNRSKLGRIVHETGGYYPDECVLLPGDCLYFKGNTSHPLDVGHVEMYVGNGKICGHGSGAGPKTRSMRDYCASRANSKRRYFMAIRWIQDEVETGDTGIIQMENGILIAPGSWNVRSGPGTQFASVGTVQGGDVLARGELGDWIPVIYGGQLRFISPKAVQE